MDRNNCKISVIVPVYNTEKYVARCLDSVLQNSYENLEVICVNDGSLDGSAKLLERYSRNDPRVIVINQTNQGISAARNTGMQIATGEWVAFIDSDDWIHPQYFEILLHYANYYKADISVCGYESTWGNVSCKPVAVDKLTAKNLDAEEAMEIGTIKRLVWGRLYRRECVEKKRFVVGIKWGEDTLFSIDTLCDIEGKKIVIIDAEIYFYFQREDSVMHVVHSSDKLALTHHYMQNIESLQDGLKKRIYLSESIKQTLAYRYSEMYNPSNEVHEECKRLLRQCRNKLMSETHLPERMKIVFAVFILFPGLYRYWRIMDDPTLIKWEKDVRMAYRAK